MAFLCLLCRQSGHKTADCPNSHKALGTASPGPGAVVFSSSSAKNDALCQRCTDLRLLDLLLRENVQDELGGSFRASTDNLELYRSLGAYRAIVLVDTCPLCRLLFGIFPPEDANIEPHEEYLLKPLRTYNRLGGTMEGKEEAHEQYSVSVSIIARPMLSKLAVELLATQEYRFMYETSIGLVGSSNPSQVRGGLPARARAPLVDYEVLSGWLRRCDAEHPDCVRVWSEELLTTSMIDVETRTVVDCPPHCQYVALSYVWGPIIPEKGALEKGTLPATIVDAIEATAQLGLRYLWVDALCIDQTPSPKKWQQLEIMDLIYAGAYATLVAFYGDSSLFGLRGVSAGHARSPQPRETVEGHELAAMYPIMAAEWEFPTCTHRTRAWTLQEEYLSKRLVIFGQDQVHYRCQNMMLEETVDETADPAHVLDLLVSTEGSQADYFRELSRSRASGAAGPPLRRRRQMVARQFMSSLGDYTARNMTQDRDSLNACLGMLSDLRRTAELDKFVWGLPLRDFPLSLMWCHGKGVRPRRRPDFPSWSYVGWQGEAGYILDILPAAEKTDEAREEMERKQMENDLDISFVSVDDDRKVLTLAGYAVSFEIRTDPFSEAFVPGNDQAVGMLTENDERHPTTLPSGVFDFVVVGRVKRDMGNGRFRHVLYLVMLDDREKAQNGGVPSRRTLVQWNVENSFIPTPEYAAMLKWRDEIQIV